MVLFVEDQICFGRVEVVVVSEVVSDLELRLQAKRA